MAMSLFGTLGIGVTGLDAQSNKLATISNNITNINTIGYKESVTRFSNLITDSSSVVLYAGQGVTAANTQRVVRQGAMQSTSSTTDLGITGNGLFVVNTESNGSGQVQYTRAGSFSPDATGNYKNSAGFYLQAWVLDPNGNILTPDTLQTVNALNMTNVPVATSTVTIGANLNSSESAIASPNVTAAFDPLDTTNAGIGADELIIPDAVNHILRGDQFTVTDIPPVPGAPVTYTYQYDGYTMGRNVGDASPAGNGDNAASLLASPVALNNPFQTVGSGSGDVIVTVPSTAGMTTGDVVSFSGAAGVGGITAGQLNTSFVITVLSPTTYQITTAGSDPAVGGTAGGGAGVSETVRPYTGAIFDAATPVQTFFGTTGTAGIVPAALSFTITTAASGTVQFTYTSGAANASLRQFNSLNNLAAAINTVSGLTARVSGGRLHVGAIDANAAVTFANGQSTGISTPSVQSGLDWVRELGFSDITAGTNRFSTLTGLADIISSSPGMSAAVINSPLGAASLQINAASPLDAISIADGTTNAGSILGELGIPKQATPVTLAANAYTTTAGSTTITIAATTVPALQEGDVVSLSGLAAGTYNGIPDTALNGNFVVDSVGVGTFTIHVIYPAASVLAGSFGAGTEQLQPPRVSSSLNGGPLGLPVPDTGIITAAYDPTSNFNNMAGGAIPPQFSRPITIYDSTGTPHTLTMGFLKTGINAWAVELYVPATDLVGSANGQIGYGTVTFNGDGTLASVSPGLTGALAANWSSTGSVAGALTFDLGTAGPPPVGLSDGLSQFDNGYNIDFVTQNGFPPGQLVSVSVDAEGNVIGNFNTGQTQNFYRIPLAQFVSADNLQAVSGNAYLETAQSGTVTLTQAGVNGMGFIGSGELESSNTDLGTQLTEMIVAQRAYQSNAKLISTSDTMLQTLTQILT
jgi:flagellar hook protein FlgE